MRITSCGLGLCFCALCAGEVADFRHPAAPLCDEPPHVRDFGPPEDCHHAPSTTHSIRIYVTMSAASSTSSVLSYGQIGTMYVDLDHVAHVEPWHPRLTSRSS
jgi:hypothetical protein